MKNKEKEGRLNVNVAIKNQSVCQNFKFSFFNQVKEANK